MTANRQSSIAGRKSSMPLVDMHTDALYEHIKGRKNILEKSDKGHLDIPRMREAGVTGQLFAIWVSPTDLQPGEFQPFVLKGCDVFDEVCAKAADDIAPARTPDEFRRVVESGRTAAVLAVEGGHAVQGLLDNLDLFFERGVRALTITWCNSNELGDSSGDEKKPHGGLSDLGREAIRWMNRIGMIVDVSHADEKTFYDIISVADKPVIASHSGVKARRDFNRNLTDDQIKELARNGGVLGAVFLPYFLTDDHENATIEDLLSHIDHVCQLVGPDHVGLGSDFDGYGGALKGLEDVTRLPEVEAGLRKRGYPEEGIRKILGDNFLRVWDEVSPQGH